MGNCVGLSPEEKEMRSQNKEVEKLMQDAKKQMDEEVKLLLLGPGESGKSTVFKQMKILQIGGGYQESELKAYRFIVFGNCITQMKVIVSNMETLNISPGSSEAKAAAERISTIAAGGDAWTPAVGQDIKTLWEDKNVREAINHKNKVFQLNDSAEYFFDNVSRFIPENYIPNEADVLRARVRSTGIEEAEFEFDNLTFCMLDVGGQRSERRKWIHCFEGVTAVIFCAAMADFDQQLREDATQNRMKESLQLFDEICNSPWFERTPFVLFLNKKDLFEEKIKQEESVAALKECFPDYDGGTSYSKGAKFIRQKFLDKKPPKTQVFPHETCAIDTKNIEVVMGMVRATLLETVLGDTGLY